MHRHSIHPRRHCLKQMSFKKGVKKKKKTLVIYSGHKVTDNILLGL